MYRLFLITFLLLNCDFLFGQEFQDRIDRTGKGQPATVASCSPENQPNNQPFRIINWTATSPSPSVLIYAEPSFKGEITSNIAYRSYRHSGLQWKAGKGNGATVWMISKSPETNGRNELSNRVVSKWILGKLTSGNIRGFVVS